MNTTQMHYRQKIRNFLQNEISASKERIPYDHTLIKEILRKIGQADLLSPCYHQLEGLSAQKLLLDFSVFAILIEEVARTRWFGLTLTISIHVGVFIPLVLRLASADLRTSLVEAALRGEILGTIASTEAQTAGSDFLGMQTTSLIEESGITLNGQKHYITNCTEADYIVVFTRWQPGRHFSNHCAILVPARAAGIQRTAIEMAVMQGAVIGSIDFEQVKLDRSSLLGRKGWGFHYFLQHIAVERLSGGVWATVVAEECLREAQHYAQHHLVGTQTLWERGAIQHRLAQAVVQITMLRALIEKTIVLAQEQQKVDDFYSATVKAAVAPIMETIIGFALQIQGAKGLEKNSLLLQHLNDFRAFGVAGGSTETMLDTIADLWTQQSAVALNA